MGFECQLKGFAGQLFGLQEYSGLAQTGLCFGRRFTHIKSSDLFSLFVCVKVYILLISHAPHKHKR